MKMNKIGQLELYIGSPKVSYNMFNFVLDPWGSIFLSNPIVTLKPEALKSLGLYITYDELNFVVAMIHALGKFYVISESGRLMQANLEWSSWYLDDLFQKFGYNKNWVLRNLKNSIGDMRLIESGIKSEIIRLSRFTESPESVNLIQSVYGTEYFPYISSFLELLGRYNVQNYGFAANEIKKSAIDDLKVLSLSLNKFWKEFSSAANSWKELSSARVTNNELLLAILGLLIPLVADVILRL